MPHRTKPSSKPSTAVGVLVVIAVLGLAPVVGAQNQEEPTWMRVNTVQVNPDRWSDFLEIHETEVKPAMQEAGVPWRSVWRTGEFGDTYEVVMVTPIEDFGIYDSDGPLSRSLSARDMERLRAKVREAVLSRLAPIIERTT